MIKIPANLINVERRMELRVLGNQGPYPSDKGGTSGYLLSKGNTNLLLDAGSGCLSNLMLFKKPSDITAVILSHLHFDHISDMLPLAYALEKRINVYLPNFESPQLELLKSIDKFNLIYIKEGQIYTEGLFSFRFKRLVHPVISYGLKLTDGKNTFGYTGDTKYTDTLLGFYKNTNLLLADCGQNNGTQSFHMTQKEGEHLKNSLNTRVLATHFPPDFKKESDILEYTEVLMLYRV